MMTQTRGDCFHPASAKCREHFRRGFTLLELMITVVIIGILATLAIYGVRDYVQRSKTAEGREMVAAIMAGQEAFAAETARYLDVTGGVGTGDFYPDAGFDGRTIVQWGADDGCESVDIFGDVASCAQNFATIGVATGQAVRFRYASTTMDAGAAPPVPASVSGYNPSGVTAPRPGYVVVAISDLDGSGGAMTKIVGSSLQADLYLEDVGE